MIIDVSSYNGKIDWQKAAPEITGAVLRSTTKNGQLDTRFMENLNGLLQANIEDIRIYKYSYAKNFTYAHREAIELLDRLRAKGINPEIFKRVYIDIEPTSGIVHTKDTIDNIICGYLHAFSEEKIECLIGLYVNHDYLIKEVNMVWRYYNLPVWLARWNAKMGSNCGFNVELWQYTNKGQVSGIKGDVDLNEIV